MSARWTHVIRAPHLQRYGQMRATLGQELAEWCRAEGGSYLEVVERAPGSCGFALQPTPGGRGADIWMAFPQEKTPARITSEKFLPCETLIQVVMIRLLLARSRLHVSLSHDWWFYSVPPRLSFSHPRMGRENRSEPARSLPFSPGCYSFALPGRLRSTGTGGTGTLHVKGVNARPNGGHIPFHC